MVLYICYEEVKWVNFPILLIFLGTIEQHSRVFLNKLVFTILKDPEILLCYGDRREFHHRTKSDNNIRSGQEGALSISRYEIAWFTAMGFENRYFTQGIR